MPPSRRLAAIMFTDIIGYSKLMNRDEEAGLALLDQNRIIQRRLILLYQGEYIKEMGDGIMASFARSEDALRCAKQIYAEAHQKGIHLRIGVHEDVVNYQGGDVFGDGVNIASRLESLGIPNSILFSGASYQSIRDILGLDAVYLGKFNLKNIARDIKIYALRGDNLTIPSRELIISRISSQIPAPPTRRFIPFLLVLLALGMLAYFSFMRDFLAPPDGEIPLAVEANSLAVMPFVNSSLIADQDYFSEGVREEIVNRLFQIDDLVIISRSSLQKYADSKLSHQQIARELGVAYLLKGSVQVLDDSVRVGVQLIDGLTDEAKWGGSYNREMKSIFSLQREIAQQIAQQLELSLDQEALSRIQATVTDDPEVWKLFMRSKFIAAHHNDMEKAQALLEESVQLEPQFAPAYAEMGYLWLARGTYLGDLTPEEILDTAYYYLNKAKALDPNYAITHVYLATMNLWFNWDFAEAEKEWNEFYRLNPSNQSHDPGYVDFLNASGRFEEALEVTERMLANDASESGSWSTGLSYYFAGFPEKGVRHYHQALELFPIPGIISDAARTFVFAGHYQEAIDLLEAHIGDWQSAPARSLGNLAVSYYQLGLKDKAQQLLGLLQQRSESSPVGSPAFYAAMVLAQMNRADEAFFYLDRAFETREVEMFWLNVEPPFAPIKSDPRWELLISKIGFPSLMPS